MDTPNDETKRKLLNHWIAGDEVEMTDDQETISEKEMKTDERIT